jgi:mycothiol synthase
MCPFTPKYLRFTDDLIPALAEIASRSGGEPCTPAKVSYEIHMPGIDPSRDVVVLADEANAPVAYAWMHIHGVDGIEQGLLLARVPSAHELYEQLRREIVLWAARRMQEVTDQTGRRVSIIGRHLGQDDEDERTFLETVGFRLARSYHRMRLDPAAKAPDDSLPDGLEYLHGPQLSDAAEFVAMFNETWIDHFGFHPLTEAVFRHDLENDPDYDGDLDMILKGSDGRFVGFSYCSLTDDEPREGEVVIIGIRRGFRGRGLGRALLGHSICHLRARGAAQIELIVDTDNSTPAEPLYQSAGFSTIATHRRYLLDHDGIIRLATLNAC